VTFFDPFFSFDAVAFGGPYASIGSEGSRCSDAARSVEAELGLGLP